MTAFNSLRQTSEPITNFRRRLLPHLRTAAELVIQIQRPAAKYLLVNFVFV